MQHLMQSGLFRILSEAPQNEAHASQLEESYEEFALNVLARIQSETNPAELYYSFGFVHLKLAGLCEHFSGEQGKKCPDNSLQIHVPAGIRYAGAGMADQCA